MRCVKCEIISARKIALGSHFLGQSKEVILAQLIDIFGDFYMLIDGSIYRHYNSNVENKVLILE
jgi:hypothetical protein